MKTISDYFVEFLMIITGMWAVYLYINYWFPGVLMWVGALGHISIVTYLLYTFIPGIGVAYLVVSMVLLFSVLSYMVGGSVAYINFQLRAMEKDQDIKIKDNTIHTKFNKKFEKYVEFQVEDEED
jgi:L-asparagine transporter-like permease